MRYLLLLSWLLCSVVLRAQTPSYHALLAGLSDQSLPLVHVTFSADTVTKEAYVPAQVEVSDYRTDAAVPVHTVRYDCLFKVRGGNSIRYDKKSFALRLVDSDGENLDANLLGLRDENNWMLDAMSIDRLRMRNRLCFDVWNQLSHTPYQTKFDGRNGTVGRFVELFLNGSYHGIYCLSDKVDRKLLGLRKTTVLPDSTIDLRGWLVKCEKWQYAWSLLNYIDEDMNQCTWNGWELKYPDDYPSATTWQPLLQLIDFCAQSSDADFQLHYTDHFYFNNLLEYVVFTLAMNVGDNGYKNTFLSIPDLTSAQRCLITPWDMDMSLGGNYDGSYYTDLADVERYNIIAPFNRLMGQNMDGFRDSVACLWGRLSGTLFSPDSIAARLYSYGDLLTRSGAWARERARWDGSPVPLQSDIEDEIARVVTSYVNNYDTLCLQLGTGAPRTAIDALSHRSLSRSPIYMLDGRAAPFAAPFSIQYVKDRMILFRSR